MKKISVVLLAIIMSFSIMIPDAAFAIGEESLAGGGNQNEIIEETPVQTDDGVAEDSDDQQDQQKQNDDLTDQEQSGTDTGSETDAAESAMPEMTSGQKKPGNNVADTAANGQKPAGNDSQYEFQSSDDEDLSGVDDKGNESNQGEFDIDDSYLQVSMRDLNKANALTMPEGMDGIEISEPKYGKGLLLTGKVSKLTSDRFDINADFDFDRNPVGRISVDGLSDRGVTVKMNVYLDDSETAAASFVLGSQMGKYDWANDGDHTADVYDSRITGTHRVSFDLEITGKKPDKETSVLLRWIEFSESSIPVMYFNIDESRGSIAAMNGSTTHSAECYGSVDLQVPDGYKSEYTGETQKSLTMDLEYLRGRGNSTWMTDKKPYKVKLDKKQDLFGMGANKHWVLLANRYDNSLMRNRMTYWLGTKMGLDYTPQCVPVDVVMNGTYYGSYLLCEQIRIDAGRVDIHDLDENDETRMRTDLPFISGGYLLSMSPYGDEDEDNIFKTKNNVEMFIESPSFEKYDNNDQRNYIKAFVQATENAIFGTGFKDASGNSYTKYLDLDAAAKYWWIQEFSANGDAYGSGSTYLYKKSDDENGNSGKLYWGPLWDFDYVAWGDLDYSNDAPEGFDCTQMPWFDRMKGDKAFTDKAAAEWKNLDKYLGEITKEGGLLDRYYEETKISRKYDNEKWGSYGETGFDKGADAETERSYKEEVDQLRTWISQRRAWVKNNLSELSPKYYTVRFMINGKIAETIMVREGSSIDDFPKAPAKKGYIQIGWEDKNYGVFMPHEEVTCDLTLKPYYIKESEAIKAKALYFGSYDAYAPIYPQDEESNVYYSSYTIMPYDAADLSIKWRSSDNSIAEPNEDGDVTLKKPGTVKITGTLASGASSSYTLHIYDGEKVELEYPTDLQLNKKSVKLKEGDYTQVVASLSPQPCVGSLNWISLNTEVADVDVNGVVVANSPGKTTIIVFDSESQLFAACEVTVTEKPAYKAPSKFRVILESEKGEARLKWNKVKGAKNYKIAYRKLGSKKWTYKTTKKTTYTVKGLKKGKLYEFKVSARGSKGKGAWTRIKRRYNKSLKTKIKAGRNRVTVSWNKDKKASGYQIIYSYRKNMSGAKKITIKNSKKTKKTIKKLKKGRIVYVRVKPLRKYKGKRYYGAYSSRVNAKVK